MHKKRVYHKKRNMNSM